MRIVRVSLVACAAVGWAADGAAQCRPAAVAPCVIELHGEGAPKATGSCGDEAWKAHLGFDLPERFADADENGWHEVVLELDLEPKRGCGCVVFRIAYEGEPTGYTANIGDSPTNNGHGGDAWSTSFDAELMVLNRDLTAYGSERPGSLGDLQVFGLRATPLDDAILELEFCDQSLRYAVEPAGDAPPFLGFVNTYQSRDLLSIRAPSGEEGTGPDAKIHAAFNRVIHSRSGRPSQNRFGAGVRRVEISLTP